MTHRPRDARTGRPPRADRAGRPRQRPGRRPALRPCPGRPTTGWQVAHARRSTRATSRRGWRVRFDEVFESLRLIREIMRRLAGRRGTAPNRCSPAADGFGAGWVEGWRGEVLVALEAVAPRPHRALPLPRPVVAELAGAGACRDRQHRSGLSADQQVLQPQLLGARPLMWRIARPDRSQPASCTEAAPEPTTPGTCGRGAARPGRILLAILGQALTIRQVDAGSCNGCELEIHALNNPYYNIEGLGIRFVASPRHADMLLVTGPVSRNMEERAAPHLRRHAGAQAGGGGGRLRLQRRHLRRELRQLRPRGQRDSRSTSACPAARRRRWKSCAAS